MKIIHSYWSKPYMQRKLDEDNGFAGWPEKSFHYICQAFSCLKYQEFYQVELITDEEGKRQLIDVLGLPYNKVKVVLDELNDYPIELWAIGKLYAYGLQKEPFLHVDNDTFIWSRFSNKIEMGKLVSQHIEYGYPANNQFYSSIVDQLLYIPESMKKHWKENGSVTEINAGVFGGSDIDFIKMYVDEAFNFISKNIENKSFKLISESGMFNTIFEQYLFYCLIWNNKKDLTCVFPEKIVGYFRSVSDFFETPHSETFIHVLGPCKHDMAISMQMSQRLRYEYPKFYYKIIDCLKNGSL